MALSEYASHTVCTVSLLTSYLLGFTVSVDVHVFLVWLIGEVIHPPVEYSHSKTAI